MDIGLERSGITTKAFCEVDPHAQSILRRHWPTTPIIDNVTELDANDFTGRIDIVSGGFPCQDVSTAGNRAGLAGERSGLWWEFHRILDDLRPEWVVIENVVGLLSSNNGRDMGTIITALGQLGYGWAYRVLDARGFGVPQRRRRIFIVCHLGTKRAAEVLFEPESSTRRSTTRNRPAQHLAANTHGCTQNGSTIGETQPIAFHHTQTPISSIGITHGMGASGNGTIAVAIPHKNGTTLRRLTPLECERLMGWPDNWTQHTADGTTQSDTQRYKQCGNGICAPVAEWLGHRIMANQ